MSRKSVAIAVALTGLAAFAYLMQPAKVVAQAGGPTVTIGGPLPLPVTGTLGINGTATVNVANGVNSPVPIQGAINVKNAPGVEPYQCHLEIQSAALVGTETACQAVPANKRLVVEHISAVAGGPAG